MQPSHLLSDLSSLSEPLCDHDAAIKLVSVHKTTTNPLTNQDTTTNTTASKPSSENADLKRANDLISLHYDVKVKYADGGSLGGEVMAARQMVAGVLSALSREQ